MQDLWAEIIDHTYVLACRYDRERIEYVKKNLAELGIQYTLFSATDGYFVDDELLLQFKVEPRELVGANGCSASTYRIYQDIVQNGYKRVAIFEDDVIFHENFKELFPLYWQQVPNDMGWLFLGYCCYIADNDQLIHSYYPLTTHAYIITLEAAQWVLDHWQLCNNSVDLFLQKLYYNTPHTIESYLCSNVKYPSAKQKVTKLSVWFSGLAYQEHEAIPLSIHRTMDQITLEFPRALTLHPLIPDLLSYHGQNHVKALLIVEDLNTYDGQEAYWLCANIVTGFDSYLELLTLTAKTHSAQNLFTSNCKFFLDHETIQMIDQAASNYDFIYIDPWADLNLHRFLTRSPSSTVISQQKFDLTGYSLKEVGPFYIYQTEYLA